MLYLFYMSIDTEHNKDLLYSTWPNFTIIILFNNLSNLKNIFIKITILEDRKPINLFEHRLRKANSIGPKILNSILRKFYSQVISTP